MTTYFIYALKHPDTMEVFYVGQTVSINSRLAKHIADAKNGVGNKVRADYINNITAVGKIPLIEVLETLSFPDKIDYNKINEVESGYVTKFKKTVTNFSHKDSDNVNCLNCGEKLPPHKGKRQRLFCSDSCRVTYHRKQQPKKVRWVSVEKYNELLERVAKNNEPEMKAKITADRTGGKKPTEQKNPLPISECTDKHPLWKDGDPNENSLSFMMKYGAMNYKEIEELKNNKK